jgi:predicted dehydrogenase
MGIGWGIMGCGDVATKKVAPSFKHTPGATLVAVSAKRRKHAEAFAKQFDIARVYDSVEDMLVAPEVRAVYIATPPHLHHPFTLAAARAGKHVLCEKPMALNTAQCQEMVEVCRSNGVQLMVAYYRRFWPQTARIKSLIDHGELGEIVNARIQVMGNVMFEPEGVRQWKLNYELSGGGFLMDVGCHRIDLLLHLLGDVVDVSAFTDSINWDYAVDNSSNLIMRFRSGALAMGAFNWTVNFFSDDFEIIGTKGKVIASPLGSGKVYLHRGTEVEEIATEVPTHTHSALIAHSIESIERAIPHPASGEIGVKVSKIVEAAYRSSSERRVISMEEVT